MIRNEFTFPKDSFLGQISQDSWDTLSGIWTVQRYKAGQFLISEEDRSNRDVFFVLSGVAKATIYTAKGREVSFVEIAAGNSFGEFSAIDDSPRSASVVASHECLAARIEQADFMAAVRDNSDISFALMRILIAHLRNLSRRVVDFNSKNADRRLHEALLDLAKKAQKRGEDHVLIERPPTQASLASFIFSSRESVAREMGQLKKLGLLTREKRAILVPSISALEDFVNES